MSERNEEKKSSDTLLAGSSLDVWMYTRTRRGQSSLESYGSSIQKRVEPKAAAASACEAGAGSCYSVIVVCAESLPHQKGWRFS